jgi:hypothetical protein
MKRRKTAATTSNDNNKKPPAAAAGMVLVILTADEIMSKGLELVGFDCHRQQNALRPTNLRRLKTHYGSSPSVYAQIWEDLQTTLIPEACLETNMVDADSYLMGIHFLKCYATEDELAGRFQICEKTVRKWVLQTEQQTIKTKANIGLEADLQPTEFIVSI